MISLNSISQSPSLISFLFKKKLISLRFAIRLVYLIWFVFGLFGIHNFLLARYSLALFQLSIASLGIYVFPWGIVLLIIASVIVLVDGFVIGALIRLQYNQFQEEKTGPRIIDQ